MSEIKRDLSDLDERFTPYWKSGERVEVVWKKGFEDYSGYGNLTNGRKARFYVGRSTGIKPIYIALLRRDSIGGAAILSSAVESIRGLSVFKQFRPYPLHVDLVSAKRIIANSKLSLCANDYIGKE